MLVPTGLLGRIRRVGEMKSCLVRQTGLRQEGDWPVLVDPAMFTQAIYCQLDLLQRASRESSPGLKSKQMWTIINDTIKDSLLWPKLL
jgi:hypothetical protein